MIPKCPSCLYIDLLLLPPDHKLLHAWLNQLVGLLQWLATATISMWQETWFQIKKKPRGCFHLTKSPLTKKIPTWFAVCFVYSNGPRSSSSSIWSFETSYASIPYGHFIKKNNDTISGSPIHSLIFFLALEQSVLPESQIKLQVWSTWFQSTNEW